MPPLLTALLALLALYFAGVSWQMRRALRAPEGAGRLREATRLLVMVSVGVPLAVALAFAK